MQKIKDFLEDAAIPIVGGKTDSIGKESEVKE